MESMVRSDEVRGFILPKFCVCHVCIKNNMIYPKGNVLYTEDIVMSDSEFRCGICGEILTV